MSDDHINTDLVARNLTAFARYVSPDLSRRLQDHVPLSNLVRNEDGDWDIEFRGELLYGTGGRAKAAGMADELRGTGKRRFHISPFGSNCLDRAAGDYLYHLMKRATEDGITFQDKPTLEEGYHLVSFGFGLGYHLPNLLELTKCRALCIVEPNLDFLYHSLAVFDWTPLLERNIGWPSVGFVVDNVLIAEKVRNFCRSCNPTSVDGSLMVQAYPNETMAVAQDDVHRHGNLIMTGLGFMVDEAEMSRASYLNLCTGSDYRHFKRRDVRAKVPAFVIGSGPSIDYDIEIIKELQDQAVILACGTSARILLSNGIKPDFMLLLENGDVPCEALAKVASAYDVGDAIMIASNTVNQKIKDICKETAFFYRQALCPYPVFSPGPEYMIMDPGPTVANTGLGVAVALGFSEIYLFGIDLGSRDPNRHHSAHSAYVRKDGDKEEDVLTFDAVFDAREVGNFGGIVFTERVMQWTRDALARVAKQKEDSAVIYNCSDGARIPNTVPKSSEAIELKSTPQMKRDLLDAIISHLPKATPEEALRKWVEANGLEQIRQVCTDLKRAIQTYPETSPEFTQNILRIIMPDRLRSPSYGEFFVRGSGFMAAAATDYYVRRVSTPEQRERFKAMVTEELHRFMDNAIRWAEWYFEHFAEYTSSVAMERDFNELPYE